ncbi:MAG: antiterminator LoaP [Lachnospiraceae bacterium]|nr:antiterminator LoaP [Lachnospiraceae bacterium]
MWYVIQVKAMHETAVVERCRSDVIIPGEDVFAMKSERMFKRHGEWSLIEEVSFQKYIFAVTEDTDDFRIRLRNVKELTKMLGVGDEVVPIRQDEEDLLRSLGGEEHVIRYSVGFVTGDRLIVTEGPLAGHEGEVKWIDRHQRLAGIETELMGQIVTIRLGCEVLKKLPEGRLMPTGTA